MKRVAIFPGQGSQFVGMCQDYYQSFSCVRERFEEASDTLKISFQKLCFQGPEETLKLTCNTQPALLLTSFCMFEVAEKEWGLSFDAVAGHSLGEYTALVAAHSLSFRQALLWVRARGQAMQQAVPEGHGGMAAILGLASSEVTRLCQQASQEAHLLGKDPTVSIVEPANYNAPGQIVIAGSQDALAIAQKLLSSDPSWRSGKWMTLPVSAPFHCSLMRPAAQKMQKIFEQLSDSEHPQALRYPYVPNCTAQLCQQADQVLGNLIQQIEHPVLWQPSVEQLLKAGFQQWIEWGPSKVLTGLIKRIAQPLKISCTLGSTSTLEDFKKIPQLLQLSGEQTS